MPARARPVLAAAGAGAGGDVGGGPRSEPRVGGPRGVRRSLVVADGGVWEDIKEACPIAVLPKKVVLRAVALVCSAIVYVNLPALRVENGSADSCDPIWTYGEITERGKEAFVRALAGQAGGLFLDIGSGQGHFLLWACGRGAFARCVGVEVQLERHERALAALQAAGQPSGVTFLLGDVRQHPQVFEGLRVAYWNNLCFPAEVIRDVAQEFATAAPLGAELWALAALPEMPDVKQVDTNVSLEMNWKDAAYVPFRYVQANGPSGRAA